jgi:hypothetical protein
MKVHVKHWHAVAQWRWDTGTAEHDEGDNEGDVCGICRVPYEGCCPACKMPGDDCPLSCGFFLLSFFPLVSSPPAQRVPSFLTNFRLCGSIFIFIFIFLLLLYL